MHTHTEPRIPRLDQANFLQKKNTKPGNKKEA